MDVVTELQRTLTAPLDEPPHPPLDDLLASAESRPRCCKRSSK